MNKLGKHSTTWFSFLFCLLACSAWNGAANAAAEADTSAPVVAAAADLQFALPEIVEAFERAGGRKLRLSFGSSGVFTRQILQGAPFELFFSADEAYVEQLQRAHRTVDAGKLYAVGRLALFIPTGSPVQADRNLADLAAAARDGRLKHLAIANPEHAPYGRAAREAMQRAGVWAALENKLVLGENATQAAQFAASGSAQAGIIPLSLARAPAFADRGAFVTLPEEWHAPLRQRMVLIQGASDTTQRFYAFMQTPAARAILVRYGFTPPAP
ncbi:MAG: molybdate ABC transporter substrate-binding protein [Betaproteobacteria bacterium]|nr:molybdate ABC transporter substrate-binding protein [Betaproteobacteria bacterium]